MMARYYVDTAIWRDLHENRKDKKRNLGELAFEAFKKVRLNKGKILYSDFVVEELSHVYDKQTIEKIFNDVSELLEKVETNENHVKEAAKLAKEHKIPFGDALHGLLARDSKAVLITRDKHFKRLKDKVAIKKPEELI